MNQFYVVPRRFNGEADMSRPPVIATQWMKHGDSPLVRPDSFVSEYRCQEPGCFRTFSEHGLFSSPHAPDLTVCPGSWIVALYGQNWVYSPDQFRQLFVVVEQIKIERQEG